MITRHHYPLYLAALAALLFFTALGARDFWAPVEPRYAEIARVMFAKGEWIVPTVNGELYTDKPILYFWLVLLASKIAGSVNEWTLRLPAALAGLGLVLTTYSIGRDFFNARVGFIAGAVLATSARVIWEARWAHTDMILALFTTLSLYFFARSLMQIGHKTEILLAYAMMALATLTKGLIGVVLPTLVLVIYMVIRREWRLLSEARPFSGALVFLLVAAPWFVWVNDATSGQWLKDFLFIHHFQRYTSGMGHRQPFYYYVMTFPVDFLPWTIFAVPAVFAYWQGKKIVEKPVSLFFLLWFVVIFLLWFVVIFLFFSISDTKRDLYLLPLFPAAALFVGTYVDDLASGNVPEGPLYRYLTLIFFNLLWIASLGLPVAAWFFRREVIWISIPFALLMAAGALLTLYFVRRRLPWNVFLCTTLMMLIVTLFAAIWALPFVDNYKSPRPFSVEVKTRVPATMPLYIYADTMNDFNFYTEREIIPIVATQPELEALLSHNKHSYLLVRERDLSKVNTIAEATIIITRPIGGKNWYLISLDGR